MADDSFHEGDVVQLKSGGPEMTVTTVGAEAMTRVEKVFTEWFDDKRKLSGSFKPSSLKKIR